MAPVNVRAAAESLALGNRIRSLFAALPGVLSDGIAAAFEELVAQTADRSSPDPG